MGKFLLIACALNAATAFALSAESSRVSDVTEKAGILFQRGVAADDTFAALPVAAEVLDDGARIVKRTPNVTCTFIDGEDSGVCEIKTGLEAK